VVVTVITADVEDEVLEVTAMVSDVVEQDGTCTLIASKGSRRETATTGTSTAPASTYCGLMTIPAADLSAGEWKIVVEYDSTAHAGQSDAESVVVP
jgi:hypothetical protein